MHLLSRPQSCASEKTVLALRRRHCLTPVGSEAKSDEKVKPVKYEQVTVGKGSARNQGFRFKTHHLLGRSLATAWAKSRGTLPRRQSPPTRWSVTMGRRWRESTSLRWKPPRPLQRQRRRQPARSRRPADRTRSGSAPGSRVSAWGGRTTATGGRW